MATREAVVSKIKNSRCVPLKFNSKGWVGLGWVGLGWVGLGWVGVSKSYWLVFGRRFGKLLMYIRRHMSLLLPLIMLFVVESGSASGIHIFRERETTQNLTNKILMHCLYLLSLD